MHQITCVVKQNFVADDADAAVVAVTYFSFALS